MSDRWFRWYEGVCTDPKMRVVAHHAKTGLSDTIAIWAFLLETASKAEDRGDVSTIDGVCLDVFFNLEEGAGERTLTTMAKMGLLKEGRIASWEKRQPLREDSPFGKSAAQRQRESRERKRLAALQEQNEDMSHNVTQCHTPVTQCHTLSHNVTNGSQNVSQNDVTSCDTGCDKGCDNTQNGVEKSFFEDTVTPETQPTENGLNHAMPQSECDAKGDFEGCETDEIPFNSGISEGSDINNNVTICHEMSHDVTQCHADVTHCHTASQNVTPYIKIKSKIKNNTPPITPPKGGLVGEKKKSKRPVSVEVEEILTEYAGQDSEMKKALFDFALNRKELKSPLTEIAAKRLLTKLGQLAPNNREGQIAVLNNSIVNGWKGVFPVQNRRSTYSPMPQKKKGFDMEEQRQIANEVLAEIMAEQEAKFAKEQNRATLAQIGA